MEQGPPLRAGSPRDRRSPSAIRPAGNPSESPSSRSHPSTLLVVGNPERRNPRQPCGIDRYGALPTELDTRPQAVYAQNVAIVGSKVLMPEPQECSVKVFPPTETVAVVASIGHLLSSVPASVLIGVQAFVFVTLALCMSPL